MKRFFSILLLLIFLFNTVGYRFAFFYLIKEADSRLELKAEQISSSDKHLVMLKIPVYLPYQTESKEFEPVDGEVLIKGIMYKYVKRKICRDTLVLLCLEHQDKNRLEKSSADYFKKSNGLESNSAKKIENKQSQEFYIGKIKPEITASSTVLEHCFYADKRSIALQNGYHRSIDNPPEVSS